MILNFGVNIFSNLYRTELTLLYALFTPLEYLAFSYFLYLNIREKLFRKLIIFSNLFFITFLLLFYFVLSPPEMKIDSIPIGIETILILVFSFYYLYEQANDTNNLFIYNKYSFWIVLGFIIYLSGSFFIYIFTNQLSYKEIHKYWFLTNIFSILKNVFFTIAIIINANQHTKKNQMNYKIHTLY